MKQINVFKYNGNNGCIVSPLELPMDYEPMIRLVADNNMCLKNKETEDITYVIDIYPNELDNWEEIDKPEEEIIEGSETTDPDEISAEEFMTLVEEAL